jgi:hypothetical protein
MVRFFELSSRLRIGSCCSNVGVGGRSFCLKSTGTLLVLTAASSRLRLMEIGRLRDRRDLNGRGRTGRSAEEAIGHRQSGQLVRLIVG